MLGAWKRPLFNKIMALSLCLLYVGASITTADSIINQYIPLAIIAVLMAVISVAFVASFYALK
jgi:hypothetical protein